MIYLLLSILTASGLNILFKIFGHRSMDLFKVIMVNYVVCFLIGQFFSPTPIGWTEMLEARWFSYAAVLGIIFIVGFNIIAQTVHYFGITLATVMQKMSLLISVIFAILYFGEGVSFLKIIGLILALLSILLITKREKKEVTASSAKERYRHLYLPIFTFLLSGLIDSMLLFLSKRGIVLTTDPHFITVLFGMAAVSAGLYYLYLRVLKKIENLTMGELLAGIILGSINYFSIYFILRLLQTGWDGSILFPMNNIGILVVSAIAGIVFFKEGLRRWNWLGLLLALMALAILGYEGV